MAWHESKIYTEEEIKRISENAEKLPCCHQLGELVWVHTFNHDDEFSSNDPIEAKVAGIAFGPNMEVRYDLFFKIEGSDFYIRCNGFRCFITKPGEYTSMGDLVSVADIKEQVAKDKVNRKQHLRVVP